jgi:prephenate dehydrogenase
VLANIVPAFYNARVMNASSERQAPDFESIAIIGVGLIGGSIAAALKKRGYAGKIVGVGRELQRISDARAAGLIDVATVNASEAAFQADLLIFCTPVDQIATGVREAAPGCRSGTLITDAGSVKGTICHALSSGLPERVTFIGSHPLAGSEKQGFEHADANLFERRVCVVTPDGKTPVDQLDRLKSFWQWLGSTVLQLSPEVHDRALAETSHLPHVVAAALAATMSGENRHLASTGFCDTTRIAAGDPDLWTAILLANADETASRLKTFGETLHEFAAAMAQGNAAELRRLLQQAKAARESVNCERRTG